MENNTPYELPHVEDMIQDEELMRQHIRLKILLHEGKDLDEAIGQLIKASNKLCAAFLVAHGIIEDFVEIPKETAYKRIERATRALWSYLLAIRANAGVENGTDGFNTADERRAE
ncbi:MAG: hypothetical protein IIZ83_02275 [Oscillospiraceae bacterium]|nr:hypothetical protein [Oscillospiraceae bacterium]